MHIDHVCVAVRSIDIAVARLGPLLGYEPRTTKVENTRQKVNVLFLSREGSIDIKLIEPAGKESPLWTFLQRGEGLHHICFRTEDTRTAVGDLAARGMRILSAPEPGEAFDDGLIAFGYAGCGLNLEFIDTDRRRGEIAREGGL